MQRKVFEINFQPRRPGLQRLASAASRLANQALGLDRVNDYYHRCTEGDPDGIAMAHRALDGLHIKWRPAASDLARIPRTGPLIVVSNHPFGALEGLIVALTLNLVRPDVKLMANFLLGKLGPLRDLFILVDPFNGENSAAANIAPMRESMRQLKRGGVLAIFPAGEVASVNLKTREIVDPPWSPMIARLIRHTGAPVLPIYFSGRNSVLFQILGVVHPRLRTALLAREMFNKKGPKITPTIGSVIPFDRLEKLPSDEQIVAYLRQRTYLLRHRAAGPAKQLPTIPKQKPIIPAIAPDLLERDVQALPAAQMLVKNREMNVYFASAQQIPNVLREIGRLREIAFRETGEGTGSDCDLDSFDDDYLHLFLYQSGKREIVGGYRMGLSDEILAQRGPSGLYINTLFSCKPALLNRISPGVELGRSFIRLEYQKSFSPLMMIWKGIGHFLVRHPKYRYIMGPVSISNRYQSVSKQLMVKFLQYHHCLPELVRLVTPRNPFRTEKIAGVDSSSIQLIQDSSEVSDVVADLEPQSAGIPVLLRQYLKLGAKLLAFNVDPAFADCVDGLMICDMAKADARMLDRYMGVEGRRAFFAYHGTLRETEPALA